MVTEQGGGTSEADGGPVRHIPVLLSEVLAALDPAPGKVILDGTFGAGGYASAILDAGADVIALDRDPTAIAAGQSMAAAAGGKLKLIHSRFSQLAEHAPAGSLDGVVLDIGVSSMQIDEAERGFSFQKKGPLDMRMSAAGVSAADVVNRAKVSDLIRIFGFLGEEKQSGRIARAIEKRRAETPFETTRDLAGLIEIVTPRKAKDKIHPATRVFQALRIFVNDELGELAQALCRRAGAEAGRPSRGRHLPFARRPDRQGFLPGSLGQGCGFAPSATGDRACGNLHTSWKAYGGRQRGRSVPQSARPVCQAQSRYPHGSAIAGKRSIHFQSAGTGEPCTVGG